MIKEMFNLEDIAITLSIKETAGMRKELEINVDMSTKSLQCATLE